MELAAAVAPIGPQLNARALRDSRSFAFRAIRGLLQADAQPRPHAARPMIVPLSPYTFLQILAFASFLQLVNGRSPLAFDPSLSSDQTRGGVVDATKNLLTKKFGSPFGA